MLQLGAIAFAHPWLLAAALALPALWWLLRITPPSPRLVRFPALRLLLGLVQREETPARTPLWLILLRLVLASLIILGLAEPLLNPVGQPEGGGPLLVVIDNGWAAARNWPARTGTLDGLIDSAARDGRSVMLLPTAAPAGGGPIAATRLMPAAAARRLIQALKPEPWPTDRAGALAALGHVSLPTPADVVWLSDGVASPNDLAFAERLQRSGPVKVLADAPQSLPQLLLPPARQGADLALDVVRASANTTERVRVRALDERGHPAAEIAVTLPLGKRSGVARFNLPVELRNALARVEIVGERSAAATVLLDERWRRRPVGIISATATDQAEPLLGGIYYLMKALAPYSEARVGTLDQLLQQPYSVLILSDKDPVPPPARARLEAWIEQGGTLLRFAGPRLAEGNDDLVPVRLRQGAREMGGAMSWSQPEPLAPFDARSPFAELTVPKDVEIRRQVLAEPSLDLDAKTWARLADGTPLVTAAKRGKGWLILVHTTAGPDWSNLPFSGLFVEMLQRIVALSAGVAGTSGSGNLPPYATLDGFGELGPPPPASSALGAEEFNHPAIGPRHPPGYYGTATARRALNLTAVVDHIAPIHDLPPGVSRALYSAAHERDLKPWLLGAALLLALIDLVISLWLRGLLVDRRVRRTVGGAAVLMLAAIVLAPPVRAAESGVHAAPAPPTIVAQAQESGATGAAAGPDAFALEATSSTRLAYVVTGDPRLDEVSRAGLVGLTAVLNQRTAVETGPPMAVDIDRDELAFFPLLYWPIPDTEPTISSHSIEKLSAYLRNGGQILFDTRDPSRSAPSWKVLRRLLVDLDLPALIPVPDDHVLTRSFYLLHDFPGRLTGSTVWVERSEDTVNDGVSAVVIGGNDWAGAWAMDPNGRPLEPIIPGGERQREMAYRFGVNLVMYALTGNYKSDQVHLPAILERLGL